MLIFSSYKTERLVQHNLLIPISANLSIFYNILTNLKIKDKLTQMFSFLEFALNESLFSCDLQRVDLNLSSKLGHPNHSSWHFSYIYIYIYIYNYIYAHKKIRFLIKCYENFKFLSVFNTLQNKFCNQILESQLIAFAYLCIWTFTQLCKICFFCWFFFVFPGNFSI